MFKKSKVVATLLSTAIALSASIPAVTAAEKNSATQFEKTYSIVVNGKSMEGGSASEENGILSVQLAPIIKAVGDFIKYDADTQTAIITKKDQTVVKITVGKSVAKVNKKDVLLSTKQIDNVIFPNSARAVMVDGNLHIPVQGLQTAFDYSVQVKDTGSKKIVMIQERVKKNEEKEVVKPKLEGGKLDLLYPVPSEWVPPLISSTSTGNYVKDKEILERELGLIRGAYFNPYPGSNRIDLSTIMLTTAGSKSGYYMQIVFYSWYGSKTEADVSNKTPYISREIIKFYLPHDYEKLFNIIDQGLTGKLKTHEFLNKEFMMDGQKILIKKTGEAISLFIGNK